MHPVTVDPYRALPSQSSSTAKPGPLGTFCLLGILLGPFVGWLVAGKAMGPFTEQSWVWRVGMRAALGVVWPLIAAVAHGYAAREVWNVRFLWPPVVIAALVSIFSLNAVLDLARGPVVREVNVTRERTVVGGGRGSPVVSRTLLVLDDGTEVVAAHGARLRFPSRVRLTWLVSTEVALRVEPLP